MAELVHAALGWAYSAVFLALYFTSSGRTEQPARGPGLARAFFYAAFLGAVVRQYYLALHGFGQTPTYDEILFGRIYLHEIISGRPVFGGLTQGVAALLYGGWYRLFGPSIESARLFSSLVGLSGVLLYVAWLGREFGEEVAAWAGALFCSGTYVILFCSLGLEVTFAFCVIPLYFLLASRIARSPVNDSIRGFLFALTLFTYPGVVLFFGAYAVAATLVRLLQGGYRKMLAVESHSFYASAALTLTVIYGVNRLFFTQTTIALNNGRFLQGGGILSLDLSSLFASLSIVAHDLFLGGISDYIFLLPLHTFLEQSLWGAFLVGAVIAWRTGSAKTRSLLITSFLVCLLVGLISFRPGMRRGVGALVPIYLFCGIGLSHFFGRASRRFRAGAAVTLFGMLAFSSFYLVPTTLSHGVLRLIGSMPEAEVLGALERGNVYLDEREFTGFAALEPLALEGLWRKFSGARFRGSISIGPFPPTAAAGTAPCAYTFTWRDTLPAGHPPSFEETESAVVFSMNGKDLRRVTYALQDFPAKPECLFTTR